MQPLKKLFPSLSKLLFCVLLYSGCAGIPTQEGPGAVVDCRTESSPMPKPCPTCQAFGTSTWNYCFTKGAGKWTLYYMHGFTNNEHNWQFGGPASYMQNLSQLQEMLKSNAPDVVTVSYAGGFTSWLLSPLSYRSMMPQLSREAHFTSTVMPLIESRYGLSAHPRVLYGMSMGGWNAARLCLDSPYLWKGCVIQHAMINACDNWNIFDFTCLSAPLIRANFASPQEYAVANPNTLAETVNVHLLPPIFVSGGQQDLNDVFHGNFNLFASDQGFMSKLKIRGANVTWQADAGGHSDFDPSPVATFIKGIIK